jgi:hypothetical protein
MRKYAPHSSKLNSFYTMQHTVVSNVQFMIYMAFHTTVAVCMEVTTFGKYFELTNIVMYLIWETIVGIIAMILLFRVEVHLIQAARRPMYFFMLCKNDFLN